MLVRDKHGVISYAKYEVLWILFQGLYSQQFILFATYELAQKARELRYCRMEKLVRDQHSSLLDLVISCADMKCSEYSLWGCICDSLFSSQLMNWHNKPECYKTIGWKSLSETNNLAFLIDS